jgi:hypothetical protein
MLAWKVSRLLLTMAGTGCAAFGAVVIGAGGLRLLGVDHVNPRPILECARTT